MPSLTALLRHWLRTTYICNLWSNATLNDVYVNLPLPEGSGWILNNGKYAIDWEDPEKQKEISHDMDQLLHGCKCKKGCTTGRCGCKRKSSFCGPGCYCSECKNVPIVQDKDSSDTETSISDSEGSSIDLETEIVTDTEPFL